MYVYVCDVEIWCAEAASENDPEVNMMMLGYDEDEKYMHTHIFGMTLFFRSPAHFITLL